MIDTAFGLDSGIMMILAAIYYDKNEILFNVCSILAIVFAIAHYIT